MASPLIPGNVSNLGANFSPVKWGQWVIDNSTRTNKFLNSGVVNGNDTVQAQLLQEGIGLGITIPHIHSVDHQLPTQDWNSDTDIISNGLASYTEQDVKFTDAQAFGNNDYDDYVTGAQTLEAISSQFVQYWANVDNRRIIQLVENAFLNADIATAKSFGIGSEQEFNAGDYLKAMARMGDVVDGTPTTIVVNSATKNFMQKQNLIAFIQPSEAGQAVATYNGLRIITDDDIPADPNTGITPAYIFSDGAVSYNAVTAPKYGVEVYRDPMHGGGINSIMHRRVSAGHVYGTAADMTQGVDPRHWKQGLAGNTALYKPVSSDSLRQIRIVKYSFKIDPDFIVPSVNTFANLTPTSNGENNPDGSFKSSKGKGSSAASSTSSSSASGSGSSK